MTYFYDEHTSSYFQKMLYFQLSLHVKSLVMNLVKIKKNTAGINGRNRFRFPLGLASIAEVNFRKADLHEFHHCNGQVREVDSLEFHNCKQQVGDR